MAVLLRPIANANSWNGDDDGGLKSWIQKICRPLLVDIGYV